MHAQREQRQSYCPLLEPIEEKVLPGESFGMVLLPPLSPFLPVDPLVSAIVGSDHPPSFGLVDSSIQTGPRDVSTPDVLTDNTLAECTYDPIAGLRCSARDSVFASVSLALGASTSESNQWVGAINSPLTEKWQGADTREVDAGRPRGPTDYMLVAAVTPPGSCECHNGPALRFEFSGTDPLSPLSPIPPRPKTLLNDPFGVAFSPQGELFVGNRHGNAGGGAGSIARFIFGTSGDYLPNGNITGNGLEAVHGVAFSPFGELFAANYLSDTVSRFVFDTCGNAIPNGIFSVPGQGADLVGLEFSATGELFVSTYSDVSRFLFDAKGQPIFNGTIPNPDNGNFHGLRFSPFGELFLTSLDNSRVYRFLFDDKGNPIVNGSIAVLTPADVAFSPEGELFVSSNGQGGITRFLFDDEGNPVPNGFTPTTDALGGLAIRPFPA